MRVGSISDTGKRRVNNEDSYYLSLEEGIFVLADGVGGHNAGEVASQMAVEHISDYINKNLDKNKTGGNYIFSQFSDYIKMTNKELYSLANEAGKYSGMATTVVILYFAGDTAYIANIGDSRAYLIRNGVMKQITEDHTLMTRYMKESNIKKSDLVDFSADEFSKMNNTLTKALGDKDDIDADYFIVDIEPNDIFLLCTDGLYDEVEETVIKQTILNEKDPQNACAKLVSEANNNGGRDNITVIVIKVGE